jgi:hypothetical protein
MSTKFVSKNANYMVVLRPGVAGSRSLGTASVPGLYVKFLSGVVDVKEFDVVELLRAHPSYGIDFMEVKEDEVDPYENTRKDIEPDHVRAEIRYGHVEKREGTPLKSKLTPEQRKIIEAEAIKMIPGLLKSNPEILKGILVNLASELKNQDENVDNETDSISPVIEEETMEVEEPVLEEKDLSVKKTRGRKKIK